jgi:hypothetical protein
VGFVVCLVKIGAGSPFMDILFLFFPPFSLNDRILNITNSYIDLVDQKKKKKNVSLTLYDLSENVSLLKRDLTQNLESLVPLIFFY